MYSSAIQKIPTPRFIVFYNGTKSVEDKSEFRLSSAYENPTEAPDLELRVTMLNINEGHNKELMKHCKTLKEYAQYVTKVRKYVELSENSIEEAVEQAVNECIEEGILAEFLLRNKAEVIKVSIYEYDKENEEKKLRKAEFEAGFEAGKQEIILNMYREGFSAAQIEKAVQMEETEIRKIIEKNK